MPSMTESPIVRRINQQCVGAGPRGITEAVALLKRANRYVGTHASIGGQALGITITEFIAAYERQPDHFPDPEKMVSAAGGKCNV